ncbi:alpha/beta fold hydrolase [Natronomonas sp. EA1]|uniref:alpha/beta fold hydrolase n=1 Tax=Natronomonas sp. EA1 TaxID=3421655 RepID=UPI003EBEAC8E
MKTAEDWADARGFDRDRVDVGEVALHYVAAGDEDAPLLLLLHGFPEFWYAWRDYLDPLAEEYRVVAPDLRGYNESDRPEAVEQYALSHLRGDVAGLIDALGHESAHVVGHDWGGTLAQSVALHRPDVVENLVVMNAPYPERFFEQASLRQLPKSWYVLFFQTPIAERAISLSEYRAFAEGFRRGTAVEDAYSEEDIERYRHAWGKPDATTAMVNWYRALAREEGRTGLEAFRARLTGRGERAWQGGRRIKAPTLLLWGEKDVALTTDVARFVENRIEDCEVRWYPDATHWLPNEYPERVLGEIRAFLSGR